MGSLVTFPAINAKISALRKKLLTDEQYLTMLNMETGFVPNPNEIRLESLPVEQINYLKRSTEYGKNLDAASIYPTQIIRQIRKLLTEDVDTLKYYFSGSYRRFYLALLKELEVQDIINLLRMIVRQESFDNAQEKLAQTLEFGMEEMASRHISPATAKAKMLVLDEKYYTYIDETTTLHDFIEGLADTNYYRYLKVYEDEDPAQVLFLMEMNLERYFYSNLIRAAKYLSDTENKIVKKFFGQNIDLLNLEWIFRGKSYYNTPNEILFNFTIIGGLMYNLDELKSLCDMELDEFMDTVSKSNYKFLLETEGGIDIFRRRKIERHLYYLARKYLTSSANDLRNTIGYYQEVKTEIHDIAAVLEAKRFELSTNEALPYLIRIIKGSDAK